MKKRLPELIKTGEDFSDILGSLDEMQRTAVYEAMKNHLPGLIKTSEDLIFVKDYLTTDQFLALSSVLEAVEVSEEQTDSSASTPMEEARNKQQKIKEILVAQRTPDQSSDLEKSKGMGK